ncbi:uncharacterized protein B0H18DRAFT_1044371 [Fomitopsis serialis]|uniref:uncharacterized protein n=1 Tax=Fomitopsis serialis TaxID=139415 RepID=UPI002007F3D0|nr:uncharacterized protein B0H18DRAFT_1044371 [Neoantrodia serialis]KAH9914713.1 hypothetical protein B0H18DRAFT_1044371 [Neoantrodia serialis]
MDPQHADDMARISLDSIQDWHRLKANYTAAAMSAFEEELSSARSTAERDALLKHLQQFIDRTFDMTRPNIRINGRNFEEMDISEEEEEPFDEGFDRHIWALAHQSLQWDSEIAARRRKHPREIESQMEELFQRQRDLDQEAAAEDLNDDGRKYPTGRDLPPTTYENIQQVAMQVNAISEELKQSVPLQSERSERVQVVAAELKALKP